MQINKKFIIIQVMIGVTLGLSIVVCIFDNTYFEYFGYLFIILTTISQIHAMFLKDNIYINADKKLIFSTRITRQFLALGIVFFLLVTFSILAHLLGNLITSLGSSWLTCCCIMQVPAGYAEKVLAKLICFAKLSAQRNSHEKTKSKRLTTYVYY